MVSAFVFLIFLSESLASVSSTSNSSLWPWGAIQPPFPIPALYDVGLSDSMHASVELGHGSDQVPVAVTFSFMHPSSLPCPPPNDRPVGYNYTIVLRGKESRYPRHIGPFFFQSCKGEFNIPLTDLHKDYNYSAFVVAFNNEISLKSKEVYFSTSDVSWARIYKGAHHILIVCHFTRGSHAKGCHVRLKILNAYTSEKVKTKTMKLKAHMERSSETRECIKLNKNLALGGVEVHDWKEDGRIGAFQVMMLQTKKSVYTPCYMISPTEWKLTTRLLLFAMSAAFFISGTMLILIGILCRLGRLHRHFRRDSYKVLQREA